MYRAIKPIELVGSAWTKQDKDRRSPQLLKLIDHSTMVYVFFSLLVVILLLFAVEYFPLDNILERFFQLEIEKLVPFI